MTGISRGDFLDNVRKALGSTASSRRPEYAPLKVRRENQRQKAVTIEARAQARRGELLERLARSAASVGWDVHKAASSESAVDYVIGVGRALGAGRVVRSNHELFARLPLDAAVRQHGGRIVVAAAGRAAARAALRQEMAVADIGVTGVDYAIAETGTCVLVARPGLSRLVSLLPPVHIAIVEPSQVYETMDDLFALRRLAYLLGRASSGSYLSLITGPSRTADIEQTLVTGVHGPVEAHMVILDQT